jgi:hypothetical protein
MLYLQVPFNMHDALTHDDIDPSVETVKIITLYQLTPYVYKHRPSGMLFHIEDIKKSAGVIAQQCWDHETQVTTTPPGGNLAAGHPHHTGDTP